MKSIKKDILIVGAGIIGSSVAMHLSQKSDQSIGLIDLDFEGGFSSSERNAGGVRATWNQPINVLLSKESIDYFETIADEIGFKQNGYFWMYDKNHWPIAKRKIKENKLLQSLPLEFLEPEEIQKKFSFIDKNENLGGATFSLKDGLLNPNLLKLHYRNRSIIKGNVEFFDKVWIQNVEQNNNYRLSGFKFSSDLNEDGILNVLSKPNYINSVGELICFEAKIIINCAGAWANTFAKFMGVSSFSYPIRRQVSLFECKEVDLKNEGMFVDTSGVYFHAEGNSILSGYADPNEVSGENFHYDGISFFEEKIWSPLFERSTKFSELKHITGWAGLYEVSPDKTAVLGKVTSLENAYEAHSFSGRGVMQSFAAGKCLAEKILQGKYENNIFEKLSSNRFDLQKDIQNSLSEDLLI